MPILLLKLAGMCEINPNAGGVNTGCGYSHTEALVLMLDVQDIGHTGRILNQGTDCIAITFLISGFKGKFLKSSIGGELSVHLN